ncbi:putative membrane protein [Burkholderia pseudomallei 668]|nr:putative membrane protein [Burkholderia pseudomallei 668]
MRDARAADRAGRRPDRAWKSVSERGAGAAHRRTRCVRERSNVRVLIESGTRPGSRSAWRFIVRFAAWSSRSIVNRRKNAQTHARAQGFLTKSCVVPESD